MGVLIIISTGLFVACAITGICFLIESLRIAIREMKESKGRIKKNDKRRSN